MILFVRELISGSVDKCLLRPLSWTRRPVSIGRSRETYERLILNKQYIGVDRNYCTNHAMSAKGALRCYMILSLCLLYTPDHTQ